VWSLRKVSIRIPAHALVLWEKLAAAPLFSAKHFNVMLVGLEPHRMFGMVWLQELMSVVEVRAGGWSWSTWFRRV
jgi:hypothetical protein